MAEFRKRVCSIIVILLGIAWTTSSFSQTVPKGNLFESWNEVQLVLPLVRSKDAEGKSVDRFTATFGGVLRLGRRTDVVDQRAGVTLDLLVNKHLSLQSSVLYRKDETVKNAPHLETRLAFGAILSKTFRKFSFRDRNLFEHRFRAGRINTNFYRHRIHISRPIKHNDKILFSPFISEEAFLDIGARSWNSNEFYAGISRRIDRRTVLEIAYIRADNKLQDANGLALNLKITLR